MAMEPVGPFWHAPVDWAGGWQEKSVGCTMPRGSRIPQSRGLILGVGRERGVWTPTAPIDLWESGGLYISFSLALAAARPLQWPRHIVPSNEFPLSGSCTSSETLRRQPRGLRKPNRGEAEFS